MPCFYEKTAMLYEKYIRNEKQNSFKFLSDENSTLETAKKYSRDTKKLLKHWQDKNKKRIPALLMLQKEI